MVESLLMQFREAFPDGPLPSRPVAGDNCCPECDEIDELFGGRTWTEMATDFPSDFHHAYPLLTPSNQWYYLPAFMLSAFGSSGMQFDSLEPELTNGRLTPASFNPAQRAAVGAWLVAFLGGLGWDESPPHLAEWWAEAAK